MSDDSWVIDIRFALREAVEIISPWGTAEASVIAAFFTVPNITNIAHWMFDDKKPCPEIEEITGSLETCITVKSHLLALPGVALVAWIVLVVILGRVVLDGQRGLSYLVVEDDDSDVDEESRLYLSSNLSSNPSNLSPSNLSGHSSMNEASSLNDSLMSDSLIKESMREEVH